MTNADALLSQGNIKDARADLIERVRSAPGDFPTRMFLFQIFALTGEWDRAKAQLDLLAKLDPSAQMLSAAYKPCLEAEAQRAAVFSGEADISFFSDTEWSDAFAKALRAATSGAANGAADLDAALQLAPTTSGRLDDGTEFDWIADADPRFGPALEVIVAGRYGLLPIETLEKFEIKNPADLRDTVWAQAEFSLRQGARIAGFVFARYPGSASSDADSIVLGRETRWSDEGGLEMGLGQKLLALSTGDDISLLNAGTVRLSAE